MRKQITSLVIVVFALIIPVFVLADESDDKKGKILGKIIDANEKTAIAFANVGLYAAEEKKLVCGAISEEDGSFTIDKIVEGKYYVEVKFIGYIAYTSENYEITSTNSRIKVAPIELDIASEIIDEVEVVAQQRAMVYKMDKKIIDADSYSSAAGGTAVNILENVPSVAVDVEGNVTLRGSASFTVFIDGRPSLFEGGLALEQIPAGQVKNIEIITNPSARYDAEGTAGIINVVTKKSSNKGWNGIINISGNTAESNAADFVMTNRLEKFYWKAGARYFRNYRKGDFDQFKQTIINDTISGFESSGDRTGKTYNASGIAGFGFFNDKSTFDFELEGGDQGSGYRGDLIYKEAYKTIGNEIPFEEGIYESYDFKDLNEDYISGNMNYKRTFSGEGHTLTANLYGKYGESLEYFENELTRFSGLQKDGQRSWEEEFRVTIRGGADYIRPINGGRGKLETGYLFNLYIEDGDYGMEDYDEEEGDFIFRDEFYSVYRFKRDIHALYGILSDQVNDFSYQLGLRGEYTYRYLGSSEEWASQTENRFDLFPSGHIAYQLPKEHQISASYSRRTVRPRLHFLEPYVTFADSYTARTGNPDVRPEYVNSFELGWQKNFDQDFISFEVFHRRKQDKIERIRTVYRPNVTLDSISNVGNDYSSGAEAMALLNLSDWWLLNTSANLFYYRIESEYKVPGIDDESLNWQARFSNTFTLGSTSRLQFDGNYVGPSVSTQGRRDAFFYTNLSFRQQFLKRRLSATLTMRDVMKTAKFKSTQTGQGLYSETAVTPFYPNIKLTLSYRINQLNPKAKKQSTNDDLFEGSSH
ncbi:Outer membrane receptor proteins, mostly Fe transport [Mariniphaga anaerophila]|uniref:Outer membrane receptor proteins, mostly Fe transport n=1 Tax=Mariniphaga anaerophila TaxID=1484053 RepID=A0A1M4U8G6_9BACT|nr:outer membrane beta-barrel family protein [Mariniphaga anaerophila]SHE52906.1 Outer membrane receptor proteins, mostly Fe transport [Mariniphaga anaerophila]